MRWRGVIGAPATVALLGLALAGTPRPAAAQTNLPRVLVWEQTLRGGEEEELRWPVAVAARSADEFAVADAFEPRLLVFRKIGVSWSLRRTAPLPAPPVGLAWDGRRYLVSLRGEAGLVGLDGSELTVVPRELPPGAVAGPINALRDGGLLLYDYADSRILTLGPDGAIVRESAVDERVSALAALPDGSFYTTEAETGTVRRYSASGELETSFQVPADGPVPAWPAGLAVDDTGLVTVVDRHASRLLVFDRDGRPLGVGSRRGWEPGLLLRPRAVSALPGGSLVVADEGNGRVQLFRRTDRSATP